MFYRDTDTGGGGGGKKIIKDTRKSDAVSGLPVNDKNKQDVTINPDVVGRIIKEAKSQGVDPYTALAVAHQETKLGTRGEEAEGNPFHILEGAKTDDAIKEGVSILKSKLAYGKKLGKTDEASQIQAYNGYGKVGMNTEGRQKSMYGLDLSKGNIDMNTNPVYGKRVMDIRDNILKKNPDIQNMVEPKQQPIGTSNYRMGTGPPDIGLSQSELGGGGGKEAPKKDVPQAPKNFAPLSVKQRTDWNGFLDYLEKNKVGGDPKLDARDQSLGMNYMNQYKKANPNFSITPEMIPNIQYDQYLLRKGESYPTLNQNQLSYVRNGLNPAYMARQVSPIDGWLGSITSRLYYPQAIRKTAQGQIDFGNDIESYTKDIK